MSAPLTLDDVQVMLRGLLDRECWIVVGWIDSGHIGVSLPRHDRRLPWAMRRVQRDLGAGTRLVDVHAPALVQREWPDVLRTGSERTLAALAFGPQRATHNAASAELRTGGETLRPVSYQPGMWKALGMSFLLRRMSDPPPWLARNVERDASPDSEPPTTEDMAEVKAALAAADPLPRVAHPCDVCGAATRDSGYLTMRTCDRGHIVPAHIAPDEQPPSGEVPVREPRGPAR